LRRGWHALRERRTHGRQRQWALEAEVVLLEHFSVSAAPGFAIVNTDPPGGESTSDWGPTGANFTTIGFHVYLFGK
jgi:hypothetical protein